jgi:sporulation protein YlmC with PRC-barrel domain
MPIQLGRSVLDKEILDCNGAKGGKIDDLRLELREGKRPVVRAIVTQEGALARLLGRRMQEWSRWWRRRVLGLEPPDRPAEIDWAHVTRIDVTVHIDLDRESAGLMRSERAMWQHWIRHFPWAER